MNYTTALALFAVMPLDCQERVVRVFDLIRASFPNVRDAFAEAVSDEREAIEIRMLFGSETEGAA